MGQGLLGLSVAELVDVLGQLKELRDTNKISYYQPYPFQKAFHHARDGDVLYAPFEFKESELALAVQRALMAGNQVGKTFSAACETTYHATGEYPDWWEGHRFNRPVSIVVAGKRNETVRDVCQNELFGDPFEDSALGTGTVPKDKIGKLTRKAGVPNALSAGMVKHVSGGWSKVRFMAFEQGPEAFMGIKFDVGWLDEEPPEAVWTQFIRGVLSRAYYTLYLTFTPEEGVTKVVDSFLNDLKPGQALVRATWDDAAHMTPEKQESFLAQLPPHEREMRKKGIPMMGSGLVFPVSEDSITIDPVEIPIHWPKICGIDFGWDHPFGAAWVAHDRDNDIVYIYDTYKESKVTPPTHASAVKKRGEWIPVVWPHDGLNTDKGSGVPLANQYRAEGLNLLREKFSNPPGPDQKEGQGGNGVEVGIIDMLTRMEEGRLKVFKTCTDWLEEFRQYHRKDGKLVKVKDDVISASRYAIMSLRFAHTKPIPRKRTYQSGATNW